MSVKSDPNSAEDIATLTIETVDGVMAADLEAEQKIDRLVAARRKLGPAQPEDEQKRLRQAISLAMEQLIASRYILR